jgi:tRNA A-37 threonylcarbamoyl transferase component Bud32
MTCSNCGARATVRSTCYCARCLLIAAGGDADAAIPVGADETPPCELLSIMGDSPRATTFLGEQTWPVRRLVAFKLFKEARRCREPAAAPPPVPRHPCIAPVLEFGRLGARTYVMTPYLAGGTLPHCYDRHRLGAGVRMAALVGIADALTLAHAAGMAHGCLTSSNLVCDPLPPFAVRIIDFALVSPAASDDAGFEVLARADLANVVRVAEALLRSPVARVAASVDLTAELSRVESAQRATEMRSALERLAARLECP